MAEESVRPAVARAEMNALTERVIGCAYRVSNRLGVGFLEKVYENALAHELRKAGVRVEQQKLLTVTYDGVVVGEYAADLFVEECLIVELKVARELDKAHMAQCLNYLKVSDLRLCLLMNFAKSRVDVRRVANGI